ncbi:MAG: methylmalonyl-CoA carboxyltransferase [Actinobacteria bacterium]|nr:methylmalonyl-CoA carboxyltransferase [Actinomycetota bacterium]
MSGPATPLVGRRSAVATARLTHAPDGRPVAAFRLEGGPHVGAIGPAEGAVLERAIRRAAELGVPVVGTIASSGADVRAGVASLHAWGRVARALAAASGVVPTVLVVTGPCLSGPALLLGLADVVIMTDEAFAYVSGPDTVRAFTGIAIDQRALGGSAVHDRRSGVAALVAPDEAGALALAWAVLDYLPGHHLDDPPVWATDDPPDRPCLVAAATVPALPTASYDVRRVIDDVVDADSRLELWAHHAPNLVTALARLGGRTVGVVANQPQQRAGTLDIEASEKAARFVQWCDGANVPLVTFVDTPGFEPGKDLEWRGMIRHGAELVHAYAAATVPRCCVVLRKAYGGAYIVMDSKGMGNDWCGAWPGAQIAVMGAPGAVQILSGRELAAIADPAARARAQAEREAEYQARFSNPYVAAERGYVDAVIDATDTRRVLIDVLRQLDTKRELGRPRPHANTPL